MSVVDTLTGRAQLTFLALKGSESPSQIRGHCVAQSTQKCYGIAGQLLEDEPYRYPESCCLEPTAKYRLTLLDYESKEYYDIPKVTKSIESDAAVLQTEINASTDDNSTRLHFETDRFLVDNAAWNHCERYLHQFYLELVKNANADGKDDIHAHLSEEYDVTVCLGTMTIALGSPR
jgi:hypothetical protein